MEEQRREGERDEREPGKGRGRWEGRAPHGLEPAGSSPWQPLELGRPSGRLGRLAGVGGALNSRECHTETGRTDKTKDFGGREGTMGAPFPGSAAGDFPKTHLPDNT